MHYPVAGIVAEYNPFHNGHLYHIEQARRESSAEAVVVVLSSDFVQRGEPAMLDKYTRTEAALACGADLVLELPVLFSAHNAGVFANAAVDILAASGIVTHIAFGAEDPNCLTDTLIDILLKESEPFKTLLKKHLKKGLSFVEARARAVNEILPGSAKVLSGSNNTLALAYMKRIKEKNYPLIPLPIKRCGSGYNDKSLKEYASAAAIRRAIREGRVDKALSEMPPASREILRKALKNGLAYIDSTDYWRILRTVLLRESPQSIARCAEISEGIEYALRRAALTSQTYEDWIDACTSKRYPAGRIRRAGFHILLGTDHWTNRAAQRLGPPYIKVLGMNGIGQKVLHGMRAISTLPIVTTVGNASRVSAYASEVSRFDSLAAELREEILSGGRFGASHKKKVIIR